MLNLTSPLSPQLNVLMVFGPNGHHGQLVPKDVTKGPREDQGNATHQNHLMVDCRAKALHLTLKRAFVKNAEKVSWFSENVYYH